MNAARLIVANLRGQRLRAVFTVGTVVVAFLLLGLLLPLDRLFSAGVEFSKASRLVVTHKASFMRPLPLTHGEEIAKLPNVSAWGHFTFFGAFYREPTNPVPAVVTDPAAYVKLVDEVRFEQPADLARWLADPTGVAVGRQLAEHNDWKVGDLVPIYSAMFTRADGSPVWTFRVAAIFDAVEKTGNTNSMVIHHRYVDEARALGKGTVGWYAVQIKDTQQAAQTAAAIDRLFANSAAETHTSTERAFAQSFLRQVGDFGAMIAAALAAVFFTLLMVTANSMAQAVRERLSQIAVLKALGFSDLRMFWLVLGESLMVSVGGGVLGMGLAMAAVPWVAGRSDQLLSALVVRPTDWLLALALMLGLGAAAALLPALRARRLSVVQGLREECA